VCKLPATCGGGGTPNVCACSAQTDAEFCMANGAQCGIVSEQDACALTRIVDCGECAMGQVCERNLCFDSCSTATICADLGTECGIADATQHVCYDGQNPQIDCGTCLAGTCTENRCR
jgi:hypothetical protein